MFSQCSKMYTIKHHDSRFMPGRSCIYCIYMDILNEFKIILWLCAHTAIKKIINEQNQSMLMLNYHTYKSMNFLKYLALCTFYQQNSKLLLDLSWNRLTHKKKQHPHAKSHSTDIQTELIDLLNGSMLAFGWTILKGAWRWVRNGYAGSPYYLSTISSKDILFKFFQKDRIPYTLRRNASYPLKIKEQKLNHIVWLLYFKIWVYFS